MPRRAHENLESPDDLPPGLILATETSKGILGEVLRYAKGNQVEAARVLGLSRNTLRAKLRALGIVVEKQLSPDAGQPEP